jgi:multimeric flavodoxin WrbA/putative sterol carrier protein
MKVYAINSSARVGGHSRTEMMLDYLIHGMRSAGAEVEVVNIFKQKINYCIGCFTCWTKTPGVCVHQDDMTKEIFPKYMDSDLSILATPLFHYTVNANMKTFIERTLPCALPFFEIRDGVTRHPLRRESPPVVVLSVAGFPELSVFNQLHAYVNHLLGHRLKAEIYIPAAESFSRERPSADQETVLSGIAKAGEELIKKGTVSQDTMNAINTPTMNFETMAPLGNIFWQTCIDERVTPREFYKCGLIPRPDSIDTFLQLMESGFNPKKASGFRGSYQFCFSGEVKEDCFFEVIDNKITTGKGVIPEPDVTIRSPFEVWMDILTRKADGQKMFMEQKYLVEGDMTMLIKMGEVFSRD